MGFIYTDEDRDERHGLYWEEVGKIVDAMEDEITGGFIRDKEHVQTELDERAGVSEWVTDSEHLAIDTLLFSQHACASLLHGTSPGSLKKGNPTMPEVEPPEYWADGDSFPFGKFAQDALVQDCAVKIHELESYKGLPDNINEVTVSEDTIWLLRDFATRFDPSQVTIGAALKAVQGGHDPRSADEMESTEWNHMVVQEELVQVIGAYNEDMLVVQLLSWNEEEI